MLMDASARFRTLGVVLLILCLSLLFLVEGWLWLDFLLGVGVAAGLILLVRGDRAFGELRRALGGRNART